MDVEDAIQMGEGGWICRSRMCWSAGMNEEQERSRAAAIHDLRTGSGWSGLMVQELRGQMTKEE